MGWSEIGKTLAKEAPLISTVLAATGAGAPVAAAVVLAGKIASSALGVPNTPEAVDAALKADPEALAKVRQAELEHETHLQELAVQSTANQLAADTARYQAEIADRDSARKANVDGGTIKPLFWLSMLLLAVTLGSEVAVLFNGVPDSLPDIILGRVLGLLDSVALMVMAFWYGTTSGSARKTELLAKAPATGG